MKKKKSNEHRAVSAIGNIILFFPPYKGVDKAVCQVHRSIDIAVDRATAVSFSPQWKMNLFSNKMIVIDDFFCALEMISQRFDFCTCVSLWQYICRFSL